MQSTNAVPRALLLFLRFHLAVILLLTVTGKLVRPAPFRVEMLDFVERVMPKTIPPYHAFLQNVVIPNATLFSILVMIGELTAGLLLLTGTCTRAGALITMLLVLNFMLAKGRWFWSPDNVDAADFFSALVVMLGAAGRVWGVDAILAKRWPRCWLW
jgi:uncharacterized membrane protein YphA (DoxX/SURF4 family)